MGFAQVLTRRDTVPDIQPRSRSNVVPLRAPRVRLEVLLTGTQSERLRADLATLFHSPLGVYVSHTEVSRDNVCVHLNIAPEDLDFTLHTLITTLSEATIGRIAHIGMRKEG
jgi:hypothetical protein